MPELVPTVMGPGADSAPNSLYDPPKLHAKTDKFMWRQAVRIWAQKIRSFAKGGDNKAKGIANSLGITLYSAMDYSFIQVIDSAITAGELKLVSDDDEDNDAVDQKAVIEKIIQLVAKDSVTDGVRRLVKMSQNIHSCKRQENETYDSFAERFRGVAQTYLNHCHAGDTSQDSQNFAMLLLENANLPSSTFNNIVSILIADAKDKSWSTVKYFKITKEKFAAIENSFENAIDMWKKSLTDQVSNEQQAVASQKVQELWDAHKLNITTAKTNKFRYDTEERAPYAICLNDAVAALKDVKSQDITQDQNLKPPSHTPAASAYNNAGRHDGGRSGTMMTKRHSYKGRNVSMTYEPSSPRFKFKARIPANTGPKSNTRCVDCGELGHWKNDPECKTRRDPKRMRFDTDRVNNDAFKPSSQYFQ